MPTSPSVGMIPPDTLQYRRATTQDADVLREFAYQIYMETFAPFNTPENMECYAKRSLTVQKLRSELEDTDNIFMLVEQNRELVAYYKLQIAFGRSDSSIPAIVLDSQSILLERFYVGSQWHGAGIAHHMMQHCIDLSRELGKDLMWLGVWEHNPKARRFYEKKGFQVIGSHIFMMGEQPQTDHWMGLSLRPQSDLLRIVEVNAEPEHLENAKALFREYQLSRGLPLDFQGFDQEIENLPGHFKAPEGALYVALWDEQPVGCVAFYEWAPGICELKRLFVKPETQGKSLGRKLMERAIADSKNLGYAHMRLDSLRRFESAGRLYPKLGFYEIPPYNDNPYLDVYYMELAL